MPCCRQATLPGWKNKTLKLLKVPCYGALGIDIFCNLYICTRPNKPLAACFSRPMVVMHRLHRQGDQRSITISKPFPNVHVSKIKSDIFPRWATAPSPAHFTAQPTTWLAPGGASRWVGRPARQRGSVLPSQTPMLPRVALQFVL